MQRLCPSGHDRHGADYPNQIGHGFWIALPVLLPSAWSAVFQADAADPIDRWSIRTPPWNTNYLNGVAFGSDRFIAVGDQGVILHSSDGANWEAVPPITTKDLHAVTYANGLFAIGGADRLILTSTNGVAWQKSLSGTLGSLFCGTHGNGQFVFAGTKFLVSSFTGDTWNSRLQPFPEVIDGIAYGNGRFVAVGWDSDTYLGALYTSADAVEWTPGQSPTADSFNSAVFASGVFVLAGDRGTIMTSSNGETWTPRPSKTENTLWAVDHGNNTFVAVGWDGTILTSPNAADWTQRPSGTTQALYAVAYGQGTFVAVGRFGTIVQSEVLMDTSHPETITLSHPQQNGDTFSFQFNAIVGESYQVQASDDLTQWVTLSTLVASQSTVHGSLPAQRQSGRSYRVVKPQGPRSTDAPAASHGQSLLAPKGF
ncbi:MAG: hypothetical protein U1G07_25955 [Verrucomicrobiota bacterium]